MTTTMQSLQVWQIGFGQIRHSRLRPVVNRFAYRSFFIEGEVSGLNGLDNGNRLFGLNKKAVLAFFESDHGNGQPALQWINPILAQAGLTPATRVIFRGFPRVFGYAFKPVSFWFCRNENGAEHAIIVEVNNTFGERHCYVLSGTENQLQNGKLHTAPKAFYVSPFCEVAGKYRFRFMQGKRRSVVRIDHDDNDGHLLETSMSGQTELLTTRSTLKAVFGYPLFTLGVIVRIHWQALRLWLRRVPVRNKPDAPINFVTTGTVFRSEPSQPFHDATMKQ